MQVITPQSADKTLHSPQRPPSGAEGLVQGSSCTAQTQNRELHSYTAPVPPFFTQASLDGSLLLGLIPSFSPSKTDRLNLIFISVPVPILPKQLYTGAYSCSCPTGNSVFTQKKRKPNVVTVPSLQRSMASGANDMKVDKPQHAAV